MRREFVRDCLLVLSALLRDLCSQGFDLIGEGEAKRTHLFAQRLLLGRVACREFCLFALRALGEVCASALGLGGETGALEL